MLKCPTELVCLALLFVPKGSVPGGAWHLWAAQGVLAPMRASSKALAATTSLGLTKSPTGCHAPGHTRVLAVDSDPHWHGVQSYNLNAAWH